MHTFVISMDTPNGRSRFKNIGAQCTEAGLECERMVGVNGATLSPTDMKQGVDRWCQTFCSPGMIGCGLSHIACWKAVVDRELDCALVLEDDAVLVPNFREHMMAALKDIPDDFHVLVLGCFQCSPLVQRLVRFGATPDHPRKLEYFGGTHAYIVSNEGARYLLEQTAGTVSYHIDMQMHRTPGLRLYGVPRDLAFQNGTDTSSNVALGYPNALNALLARITDSKHVSFDFYANMGMLRLGTYHHHIIITPMLIVFFLLGVAGVPWKLLAGLTVADLLAFSSLSGAPTKLVAYALGLLLSLYIRRK